MRLALLISDVAFAAWMLAACGTAPVVAPKILPPNTNEACAKAVQCEVFLPEQIDACLACIETVADKWNAEAKAYCGDECPRLRDLECSLVTQASHDSNLSACVAGRWYGP